MLWVTTLPCCVCHRGGDLDGNSPHHLLRLPAELNRKGMAIKNTDKWVIPMCHQHHMALHADGNETRFLAKYAVDGPALAAALWSVSGDYEMGCKIVLGKG